MDASVSQLSEVHSSCSSSRRHPDVAGSVGQIGVPALVLLVVLVFSSSAWAAPPPVLLGAADGFAILGGSTITNTGNSVINGDLGLHPGTAVSGFPPATVNGAMHVSDAVAQQSKTDLTTAYGDAAGRSSTATSPPDAGGQRLTAGVYGTGSVPSLGLTGNLTLDAQGDASAVFIFQIASTLTTATDSSISLINGAQACNVFWQVGSSATLGTRTAFKGTILASASVSLNDGVTVDGRLLARGGAVTLINDTVTRSTCAPGTGPGSATGPGTTAPGTGTAPGSGTGPGSGTDVKAPIVQLLGLPGLRQPPIRRPGIRRPPASTVCTTRNFTARVRVRNGAAIRSVSVYLDGRRVRRTSRTRFSLRIEVRGLRVGSHRITVVARDRAGKRSVTTRRFGRCAIKVAFRASPAERKRVPQRRRCTSWPGALALVVTLALPQPAGSAGQRGASLPTLAEWAHPVHRATIRRQPSQTSRRVARIHYLTEDGFPEVYPVLRRVSDRDARVWLRISIPMRPRARTGWVPRSALGPVYRVRTRLVIDRKRLNATLYRSGRRIWRSAIGVGTAGSPTPAGLFWIREKFTVANPDGPYGPHAFGTSGYSRLSDWPGGGVIGIHGTDEPELIPGRPSHGCIRVPNPAIGRLYRLMAIGTPMLVR